MTDVGLDRIRLGEQTADLRATPLAAAEHLAIMGQLPHIHEVLAQLRARIAGTAAASGGNRLHAQGPRANVRRAFRSLGVHTGDWTTRLARHFGLRPELAAARVGDLDGEAAARAQLTLEFALALASGHGWVTVYEPFMGLRGATRAGLRTLTLQACDEFNLGLLIGTNNRVDAALCAPGAIVVEQDQVADAGALGDQLAQPRSNLAAAIAGVNVFSALARGGWISIGHSQVKAPTELDGKLYVTIPTDAARLSLDEFDPAFTSDTVFEALVTGLRDTKDRVQVTLSPSDTEVGLMMTADLFDFRTPPRTKGEEWGLLHHGLGATIALQQRQVRVGTHLWAQVLTDKLSAYPVDLA